MQASEPDCEEVQEHGKKEGSENRVGDELLCLMLHSKAQFWE